MRVGVADSRLRMTADIDADIERAAEVAEGIPRNALVFEEQVFERSGIQGLRLDEEAMCRIERLEQAGGEEHLSAELHFVAPLGAERVQPGPRVSAVEDEGQVAILGRIHAK